MNKSSIAMNAYHAELLLAVKANSEMPTKHTFLNNYLGTAHPRYAIDSPSMRAIAKAFMKSHSLDVHSFVDMITSLIEGKSFTEKVMAGLLLDYAGKNLWSFDPIIFNQWLLPLQGWAEVDTLCTGKYASDAIPEKFTEWKKLLIAFSKSDHLEKRRASLVLCCSPLRKQRHEALLNVAFRNSLRLKSEKGVMITKAISWVLRSAIKHHKTEVRHFLEQYENSLPKIAVRETWAKLKTGRKTKALKK